MKSTTSYFILLVSFIGLLFLQQYENRNNQKAFHEQNQKITIDQTMMENRLRALEVAVDSLLKLVNNQSTIDILEEDIYNTKQSIEELKKYA